MSGRRVLTLTAVLTLAACSGVTDPQRATCSGNPGPPWPATVAGCWVQAGVDTYAQFDLAQNGPAVTGTFSLCGALSGCTASFEVTGAVLYPHVTLQWTERSGDRSYDEQFDATLTPAHDTLIGTPTGSFHRTDWR